MIQWLALVMVCVLSSSAMAHEDHHAAPPSSSCAPARLDCAASATPAFAPDGRLWLAWSAAGQVFASVSADGGVSFGAPVPVSVAAATVDDKGEGRPKIAVLADGTLVVTYSVIRDRQWNASVLVSRSSDGGRSFSPPHPVVGGGASGSQRFDTMAVGPDGRVILAWIDKRNAARTKAAGQPYAGAGIAIAWSEDGGATFAGSKVVADHSCECCRVALAFDQGGEAVMMWRHVFGANLRDHAIATVPPAHSHADEGPLAFQRVSEDDWAVDACPHHGPALAIDAAGTRHVAWFTAGKRRQGLFYAHADSQGGAFSEPMGFGDPERRPSHPQLLVADNVLVLAWKEFDGDITSIMLRSSLDGGNHWTEAQSVAATADASDHPILIRNGPKAYLSWLTRVEGYRLLPLALSVQP